MDWENILKDSVKDGTIKEVYLSKVPVLRTTSHWKSVELIGRIDHKMRHSHYKGGLVKLNGKLYFVQDKTINVLREYMKWNFPIEITVITKP